MKPRRVVVTGIGYLTAFGQSWPQIRQAMQQGKNAVRTMPEWDSIAGLNAKLAAPLPPLDLPSHYTRKKLRSMGRVAVLAVRSSELALEQAGLLGSESLRGGRCGVAFGSCAGEAQAQIEAVSLLANQSTADLNATTYVRMMPHTTAVNVSLFFGATGRIIPTSSACTSGSQAIGYGYESIKYGLQDIMICGGAEELNAADVAIFDTLFAASTQNDAPQLTPRPFDESRDGLVIGEGSATLILEEYEHALSRGVEPLAELVGFATNCDATHVTQPRMETIQICMEEALKNANLAPSDIAYISAHGTATKRGDIAESNATANIFGGQAPTSSMKSYFGHTLGACGAIEAGLAIDMMRQGSFAPTINLKTPDEQCGKLDYIVDEFRQIDAKYVMSNNFAFGGVNTSLIFKTLTKEKKC